MKTYALITIFQTVVLIALSVVTIKQREVINIIRDDTEKEIKEEIAMTPVYNVCSDYIISDIDNFVSNLNTKKIPITTKIVLDGGEELDFAINHLKILFPRERDDLLMCGSWYDVELQSTHGSYGHDIGKKGWIFHPNLKYKKELTKDDL